jgi:hypothetical protein
MRRLAVLLAVLLAPALAAAHEFRPAVLDLDDLGGGRYEAQLVAPGGGLDADAPAADLAPTFPADCRRDPPERAARFLVDCGPAGLAGRAVTLRGLVRGDALVRFHGPAGTVTAVLRPAEPTFVVPDAAPSSRLARARGYLGAGVEHILRGPDHLLFVLGLLMLVRGRAALIRTITAFTLAHSVTLALAATAAVRLPPAPVEAVIAWSLVVLAAEIARGEGPAPTLARRRPALLAFAFGLLHGFGFAGGLAELRVPAGDLPLALGLFNVGVEAGQLAFVAVALVALALLRRPLAARRAVPAFAMGSLACFWLVERLARFWS